VKAVVEVVEEAGPDGAPMGPMYLAFQASGMSLEMFTQVVDGAVGAGLLTKRNHCLYRSKVPPDRPRGGGGSGRSSGRSPLPAKRRSK